MRENIGKIFLPDSPYCCWDLLIPIKPTYRDFAPYDQRVYLSIGIKHKENLVCILKITEDGFCKNYKPLTSELKQCVG